MRALIIVISGMLLWLPSVRAVAEPLRAFVQLDSFSEEQLRFAFDYARRFARSQGDAEFELLAAGKAVPLLLEDQCPAAKEYHQLRARYPNIRFYVCKEGAEKLRRAGAQRELRLLPGTEIISCKQRLKQLADNGWARIDADAANSVD